MRTVLLLSLISIFVCLYLVEAAPPAEEEHGSAPDREAALLEVDAGAEHENESPREARGYYGHRYGGYGGYRGHGYHGYHGYGRRYGYGRHYYG